MIVRKLRLEKGWSQEHLAALSGISVRTIQRIERGQRPGLEILNALAAVFQTDVSTLTQELPMPETTTVSQEEKVAMEYVRDIKGFYSHFVTFVIIIPGLAALNYFTSPEYYWVVWPAFGWGIGLIAHGLSVFEVFTFFGPDWERRQIEKRLRR